MSNDLVPAAGAALTVPSTGAAVGEHVGDISRESAPSFDWSPQQPESVADLRRQILRDLVIDGISEREIEACLPLLEDYAPPIRAAFKTSNRQELERLAKSLHDELIGKGLISAAQLERIRPILQRYNQESERALIGPGANNSELIHEMRKLDSLMANRESRYWKGPDAASLQSRWRELYDQGVRADGQRSTADPDVDGRMGEIEALMGNPSSEYYRGSHAQALQQEYRELIERRERARNNGR